MPHVVRRHGGRIQNTVIIEMEVPRGWLPRACTRLWYCPREFPPDIAATVYHHLGIDARRVTFPDAEGRPVPLVQDGEPVGELTGP